MEGFTVTQFHLRTLIVIILLLILVALPGITSLLNSHHGAAKYDLVVWILRILIKHQLHWINIWLIWCMSQIDLDLVQILIIGALLIPV